MQQNATKKHLIVDFLKTRNMKRHLIITLATLAISAGFMSKEAAAQAGATAQTITPTGEVAIETASTVSRAGKVLAVDGIRLSADETFNYVSEHCGLPYAQRWNNSARIYGVGKGLLISSAVTIPVGMAGCVFGTALLVGGSFAGGLGAAFGAAFGADPSISPETQRIINNGAVLIVCGATLAAVGVSTLIAGAVCVPVGKSRMNDIVERCNASNNGYTVTMNFGPCPHGIGMTLNF